MHRSPCSSGWFIAGLALWLGAIAALVGMAGVTQRPTATVQATFNEAQITLNASQQAVWWNDSCTEISWSIENISGVWLDGEPTVGSRQQQWCLPEPSSYRGFYRDPAFPDWRVQIASGEVRHYTLPVYVLQPFLVRWILPLFIVGGVLMSVPVWPRDRDLMPGLRRALTIPVRWQVIVAAVAFGVAGVALAVISYRAFAEPPRAMQLEHEDGQIDLLVVPSALWGGCADIQWETDGITTLTVGDTALALPSGAQTICAGDGASLVTLALQADTEGGARFGQAVVIPVVRQMLWVLVLPGVLLGAVMLSPWVRGIRCRRRWSQPFCHEGRLQVGLAIVFVAITMLTAYNAARHNPWVAYDGADHFQYALALAEGRLPTPDESNQFFAPPLAYFVPATAHRLATNVGLAPCPAFSTNTVSCLITAKAGQTQNVVLAIATLYLTLLISTQLYPQSTTARTWALVLLGVMTVWYRSFVMLRGEAWTTFLVVLLVHRLLLMADGAVRVRDLLIYGVGTGLLIISRQWGVLAAAAMGIWALVVVLQRRDMALFRAGAGAYLLTLLVGGWFYQLTTLRFGSVTAFNRTQDTGKALDFFIGLGSGTLFSAPFRSTRMEQIIPIFYSEMWGDFGGFWFIPVLEFSVWTSSPPAEMVAYLGRVNVMGLLPTTLLVVSLLYGINRIFVWLRDQTDAARDEALLPLVTWVSLIGYGWFLATYPAVMGDTIKATYTLHVFPLLAIQAGMLTDHLREHMPPVYALLVLGMTAVLLHNLPILVTRYTELKPF